MGTIQGDETHPTTRGARSEVPRFRPPAPHSPEADVSTYDVRSVARVCEILDLLQATSEGIPLAEASSRLKLAKPTLFRYLASLERRGYAERSKEGKWHAGPRLMPSVARQREMLVRRARPHMTALLEKFGETVNLGALDHDRIVYLDIIESMRAFRLAARVGARDRLHCAALGKAVASIMPVAQVVELLEATGMPQATAKTITTVEAFLEELALTRQRGWALDDGENEVGGRCVAVPLPIPVAAAISVSAPADRFPLESVGAVVVALTTAAEAIAAEWPVDANMEIEVQ